jgi:putative endonuclease
LAQTYKQSLGKWGEQAAADYLLACGYTILERNPRTPYGEIDLVAIDNSQRSSITQPVLVFVEVKTRASSTFGLPEEAITRRKRLHLLSAISAYRQAHPDLPPECRLDVISVFGTLRTANPEITHFENVS